MGATIELKCLDSSCDQVAGLNVLLSNRRIARETMAVAMKCADALAERFGLPIDRLRDSIILTGFTKEVRGFRIKLKFLGPEVEILVSRYKGRRVWSLIGPSISPDITTRKLRNGKDGRPTLKFGIQTRMVESRSSLLTKVVVYQVSQAKLEKQRQTRLSRRRDIRHQREEREKLSA